MNEKTKWKAEHLKQTCSPGVPIFTDMADLGSGRAVDFRDGHTKAVPVS